MKKQLLALALTVLSLSGIATAQFHQPSNGPYDISGGAPGYQDLLDRCSTIVSNLESAQSRALMMLNSGSYAAAARILQTAIARESLLLPPPFASEYYPRTMEAIRVANWISSEVERNSAVLIHKVGLHMFNEIKFNTLNHAVYIAIRAYYDLDQTYYRSVFASCKGGCLFQSLPEQFQTGMQQLGLDYLNYAQTTGRQTGIVEMELMISKISLNAAKNFFARNTGRLELACVVTNLNSAEATIDDMTRIGGDLYNTSLAYKEMVTRNVVDQASAHARSAWPVCPSKYKHY